MPEQQKSQSLVAVIVTAVVVQQIGSWKRNEQVQEEKEVEAQISSTTSTTTFIGNPYNHKTRVNNDEREETPTTLTIIALYSLVLFCVDFECTSSIDI